MRPRAGRGTRTGMAFEAEPISLKTRLKIWFLGLLATTFLRFLGLTSRRINIGAENFEELRKQGKPWIFGIWHCNVFNSPYLYRGLNVGVLISASRDGDYINEVVHRFKNTSIRGSTSRRSVAALKQTIEHLKKGFPVAITPDGPRGPALELQPGIVISAQMSGVPIIPAFYECTRQWVAKSWDKHRIPKPFTSVVVSFGKPIYVPRQLSEEEFEKTRLEIQNALIENMKVAAAKVEELKRK